MTKTLEDIFEPAIPIVPAGWDVLPFEQAADVVSDKGKRIKQGSYLPAGAIPIIDQGQEPIGGYTNDQDLAYEGGLPVILFGDHTRSVKYVDRRFAVGAEGVKILRPNDAYVPKFFYYLLRSLQIPSRGYSRHFQFLRKFHFPLAPYNQQTAIVAEIEKQFSRLDEAVASLKRTKASLKRYKAAVLKAAVEGKLTEGWRKQHPDVESASKLLERIQAERRTKWNGRAKYQEPEKPDASRLATLPEGWVWTNIDQLAEVGTGATPKRGKATYYSGGHIPWVTSSALNKEHVDKADEFVTDTALRETNLSLYPPGTLLLAMYGEGRTRGKCSVLRIHATTNQAIAAIQCAGEIRDYLKLAIWNQYEDLRRTASGGVQPNLNLSLVRAITIPVPPLSEQVHIVAEVERRLSVIDELEGTVEANLTRAERLKQSVLANAFSGKTGSSNLVREIKE
ncbi:restriction endonuclease subunit S [Nitrospira moscoviensis]|uniref:Type I restriction modification DNA specificity domain-containing protein n=1 Tax=Nitrospira moscoviensis TaxID=42253 RepID=A0A0K2GCI1_NITMO|nr:restriction endonuclease subunit S [Nitrospira moscoviensis]ALA58307.1 hypothetical protein NITMOv2_1887 [Nitrospira moscoviensis]